MPTSTPWGTSQSSKTVTPGLTWYSTSGHGGLHVSKTLFQKMPAVFAQKAIPSRAGGGWFEEDCAWAMVAVSFPEHFQALLKDAELSVMNWFPAEWEAWSGKTLAPGESFMRDKELFEELHKDDYVVIAAWGSWASYVPAGYVGTCATKGSSRQDGVEETYWLVPADEYDKRGPYGFVIDPVQHPPMACKPGSACPATP